MRWDSTRRAFFFELRLPLGELGEDGVDGGGFALGLNDAMRLRVDGQARKTSCDGAEEWVDLREGLDLVAEHFDAEGVFVVGGVDLYDVAADAEGAAAEVDVVALVKDFDEAASDVGALDLLSFFEEHQHAVVGFGRAEAVDAGDRRDDDAVAAFEEAARGGETELVELVVDGGFFFDVEVAGGNVGLGLVVVVVGDEVLDGVGGEKLLELVIELRGESFVVGEDLSAGRLSSAMTLAMVKVLPEPVTPRRVWSFSPWLPFRKLFQVRNENGR